MSTWNNLKEVATKVLLLAFGLTVAAAAAEIGVRLAAAYSQDVRYFATVGMDFAPSDDGSLEDFLRPYAKQLVPHQIHNNYYTNALGFADREFAADKQAGTLRIMAIGDSFAYGSVSYPQNVLTIVEELLNKNCRGPKIEIMNFGIPGTGLWEYKTLHKLASPRYKPDRVIVHFYIGNDGPDMVFGNSDLPSTRPQSPFWSYAWSYLRNTMTLLWSLDRDSRKADSDVADQNARGGERAAGRKDLTDEDLKPAFTAEAFERVTALETARLYRGGNRSFGELWEKTIDVMDSIRADVLAATGKPPIFILYPSEPQIYPKLRETAVAWITKNAPAVDPDDFDVSFPGTMILEFCRRSGTPCHDTTPALQAAGSIDPHPLYQSRDTHWNVRGNHVAAVAEFEALRKELCSTDR